ncbi:MAG: transcription elongation factor GreA [Myxococcales bacterium]|nr:transcription elongation factor GreA [Myxococcales bacterium]
MEKNPMTPEGAQKLREELAHRKGPERAAISHAIGVARELGDLSENAEYHAARERQGLNEARIRDLEDKLARIEIIDPTKLSGDRVAFGATVKLSNVDTGDEVTYRLLGAEEADIKASSISITSPLARSLLGKSVGDEVKIRTPAGERTYEILEVEFK